MIKFQWNDRPSFVYCGGPRPANQKVASMNWRVRPNSLVWTIYRQAWAVREGFFVQLCNDPISVMWQGARHPSAPMPNMQRAVIISLDEVGASGALGFGPRRKDHPDWHSISWADPVATIKTIKRHYKSDRAEDENYRYLARFIRQQDEYGWYNAWDERVRYYVKGLHWYKVFTEAMRTGVNIRYTGINGKRGLHDKDVEIEVAETDQRVLDQRARHAIEVVRGVDPASFGWGHPGMTRAEKADALNAETVLAAQKRIAATRALLDDEE